MDIKTFVSESLTQIIQGIEQAQTANRDSVINPACGSSVVKEKESQIEFDIAVTLEKGTESKGGIAVLAGAMSRPRKSGQVTFERFCHGFGDQCHNQKSRRRCAS